MFTDDFYDIVHKTIIDITIFNNSISVANFSNSFLLTEKYPPCTSSYSFIF